MARGSISLGVSRSATWTGISPYGCALDRWWLRYGASYAAPDDRQWPLPWAVAPNGETDIDALAYQAIGPPP